MINDTRYDVYPGDYVPMFKPEDFDDVLKLRRNGKMHLPPVNISKSRGLFTIEIAIPGLSKQNFLLHTVGNILHLKVLHRDKKSKDVPNFLQREFDYTCLEKCITLPENVYPEFSAAEYKDGILRIIMPEGHKPLVKRHSRLVVY